MKSDKRTLALVAISILALVAKAHAATSLRTGTNSQTAAVKAPSASRGQAADRTRIANLYGKLPLNFERNDGQSDPQVKFLSRGPGYTLFLTEREAVIALRQGADKPEAAAARPDDVRKVAAAKYSVLRVELAGSRGPKLIEGEDLHSSVSNYFIGKDKSK